MKKRPVLKALVGISVLLSSGSSMFVSTVSASASGGQSSEANVVVSGVVRALMSTGGDQTGDPLVGAVLDTGRDIVALEKGQYEGLVPGETASVEVEKSAESGILEAARAAPAAQVYAPIADRRLLVVPVRWEGSAFSDQRMSALNEAASSLETWWGSVSVGVESLTVRVLPVQTIAVDTECDYLALAEAASSAAQQAGQGSWYTNLSLILPATNNCWWGGLGYFPGRVSWINSISVAVIAHELGHNMGLAHANSCVGSLTVSVMQSCQHVEYRDFTDVMGAGEDAFGYNAAYLNQIGWLADANIRTWTGGTTSVSLSAARNASGAIRAIRIPLSTELGNTGPGEYWLQFRNEDEVWPARGVYMNLVPTESHLESIGATDATTGPGSFTWLCDITPDAEGDSDFQFVVGSQWNDPLGRFSITVTSVSSTSATVDIAPSSVLPIGPQTVTATAELDDAGDITGNVLVEWTATAPLAGAQTEPAQWVATTEDGESCTADVVDRFCLIPGVARQKIISVDVVGKNYAGLSLPVSDSVGALPKTAPSVSLVVTPLSSEATVEIGLDDGGSEILALSVVVGGKTCVVVALTCRVEGLSPNTQYLVVANAQNAIGTRGTETRFYTIFRMPFDPIISFEGVGDHYEMHARVQADEARNVVEILVRCPDIHSSEVSFDSIQDGVVVSLPVIPKIFQGKPAGFTGSTRMGCYVSTSNALGQTRIYAETPLITVGNQSSVTDAATVPIPVTTPETLGSRFTKDVKVTVKKTASKTYKVTWKIAGNFAIGSKARVVAPRVNGRACVRASATSCIYKGLTLKKSRTLVIHVYKKSSLETFHGTRKLRLRK